MQSQSQSASPRWMFWTGWVISALPILMMGGLGTFMLVFEPDIIAKSMKDLGYPANVATAICAVEIASAVIYAIPQTAVLGAILLTGYLGGAVATHVRAGQPPYFPIIFGVLVWLGLYLRDARVRKLVPFRK